MAESERYFQLEPHAFAHVQDAPSVSLAAGNTIGKYTVIRKIAEGGMAEIFLCRAEGPEGFQKVVAIKRIRSFLAKDESFIRMFIAEARLASRLNHPNVVQIFDFNRDGDTYYLAMEYVRGRSLLDVIERSRRDSIRLPWPLVAQIIAEVARGLHYAHQLSDRGERIGLVHRDVTPHNILLSFDGAVKLADFGIAKAEKLTSPGVLKGKFAYMAPEQARGDEVDARTDIFALGIVLWEALTGDKLFDGPSDVSVLRAVQDAPIRTPSTWNPDIPAELNDIVLKALQRTPADRFQTAHELDRALTHYVRTNAKDLEDADLTTFLKKLFPAEEQSDQDLDEGSESPAYVQDTAIRGNATDGPKTSGTSRLERNDESGPYPPGGGTHILKRGTPTASEKVLPHPAEPARSPNGSSANSASSGQRWPYIVAIASVLVACVTVALVLLTKPAPPPKPQADPTPEEPVTLKPKKPVEEAPGQPTALTPDAGDTRIALPPPPPPPPPEPQKTETPKTQVAEARGSLRVKVAPWAEVFINGRRVGDVSGSRRFQLPPGTHRIKFVHSQRQEEQLVNVQEKREVVVEFSAFGP